MTLLKEGAVLGVTLGALLTDGMVLPDGLFVGDELALGMFEVEGCKDCVTGIVPADGFWLSDGCVEPLGDPLGTALLDGASDGLCDGLNDGRLLTDGLCEGDDEGTIDGWSLFVGILERLGEELGCVLAVGAGGRPERYSNFGPEDPSENSRL